MRGRLPWVGTIERPPGGINHTYEPFAYSKADGTPGLRIRKSSGYTSWAQAQVLLLRQQGIPRIAAGTPLTIILEQRVKNVRADVDGTIKVLVDVLAQALSDPNSAPWDDRDCCLLMTSKVVDKTNPGITVTILPFQDQAIARAYDVLLSMATCGKEGLT